MSNESNNSTEPVLGSNFYAQVLSVMENQRFGVFNTIRYNKPHSALVCFMHTEDLAKIVLVTPSQTRKFVNAQLFKKVNFFINSASNNPDDIGQAMTIAATGFAKIGKKLPNDEHAQIRKRFLQKHPYLEEFYDSPSTDIVTIEVEDYQIVTQFQTVLEITPAEIRAGKIGGFIKQLQGRKGAPGQVRNKLTLVGSNDALTSLKSNQIVGLETEALSLAAIEKSNVAGIFSFADKENSIIAALAKNLQIPYAYGFQKAREWLKTGNTVTLDGYLGILTIHDKRDDMQRDKQ